jgi:DNA-binding transcriptional LysR family regulator
MPRAIPLDARSAAILLRRLTMAELRALAAVKVAGTLSGAATALEVTQPTLSQHIRDIEAKLEVQLFDRHRRGVDPTPAGSVMLRLASALQLDFAQAAEGLSIAMRVDLRPVRIGSMAIASAGMLAVALGQFASNPSNRTPTILQEGPREALLEHLSHDRIDLFVGRLPPAEECRGLHRELLFLDSLVVIASQKHHLASRRRVDAQSLQLCRWVIPGEDSTFYQQVSQSLHKAGLSTPAGMVQTYTMHAIPAIVAHSDMLGFMPASLFAAGTFGAALRRLPFPLEWEPAAVGVLMREEAARDERLQPFLRTLRAVAASARMASAAERK